jgi:NADPH:quinone reductase-like Zn-dependent oxidoreductase
MAKAVRLYEYGAIEVLRVEEVPRPSPEAGQVLVEMRAAGINPGEASIRKGLFAKMWPTTFPSGEGSDLAGVVVAVGPGVSRFRVGDEVVGFTQKRASHAELVVAEIGDLVSKPKNVPWEVAGGLFVAGTTAYAAVRAVAPQKGETVVVSGAAGGVGSLAVQLARNAGAKVIGLASAENREWLEKHGVIHVAYGDGVEGRVRAAAEGPVHAFVDTFGANYVELALALGVLPQRIDTIINFEAAAKYGVKAEGSAAAGTGEVVGELVKMIAAGRLEVPIAKTYPLAQVQAAFRDLEARKTRGKIVLVP